MLKGDHSDPLDSRGSPLEYSFCCCQVLVAKSDDKWEATRALGKGPHHLVEKFSVDVLLERRNVFTFDPNCPAVKVKGNLPHLTIHISHSKVFYTL